MPSTTYITAPEIARKLGVSAKTIHHWREAGRMPAPYAKTPPQARARNTRHVWNRRKINAWIRDNFEIVQYEVET